VEVETNNNHTRRDIYNVIAVMKGSVEPGKLHHTLLIYAVSFTFNIHFTVWWRIPVLWGLGGGGVPRLDTQAYNYTN